MAATADRQTAHRTRWTARAASPVLDSKITFPPLPSWTIPRERIKTMVTKGARGPLTLVTGPPGAGKTMALASWAAARTAGGPVAWVSLDTFDNRPATFWSYLTEALRRAGTAIPADLPALAAKRPDQFLHKLALTLAGRRQATALVLDDFHTLTEHGLIDGLGYLLRNAGSGLCLLLASRTEPALPVHRYRLTGDLTEIRATDLAFSTAEAEQLMARHGVTLTQDSLVTMTRRCEGWPAGLRLAALAMVGKAEPDLVVNDLAAENTAIARYFTEEVLGVQPAPVRDLLLKTSILDRVSVVLAGELAGNGKAGQAVPALARANTFVQPMGDGWYRYHSLFSDVLRMKLRHELPDTEAQLHRRAALWLRRHGTLAEAVGQAGTAGDWHLAAQMTVDELAIGRLIDPGADEPLAAALRRMPPQPPPRDLSALLVASGIALRRGQEAACITCLSEAERMLGQSPADAEVPARLAASLIRLSVAGRSGDAHMVAAAAAHASGALGKLPADLLSRHPEVRSQVLAARGTAQLWAGHFADAAATLGECAAARSCRSTGRRALVELLRGRLSEAGRLAGAACGPAGRGRPDAARTAGAAAEVALAWVHLERHQLDAAADRLARAKGALHTLPDRLLAAMASLAAARLNLARGRPAVAADIIGRAFAGWSPPPWLEQRLALAEAYAHTAAGDIDAALRAAGRAGPPSTLPGAVALAQVRLAAAGPREAAKVLSGLSAAVPEQTPDIRLEAWLLQAELCYRSGQADRGRQVLEQALKHAGKERVLLPFVIRRAWLVPVLRHDRRLADAFRVLFPAADVLAGRPVRQPAVVPGQDAPLVAPERLSGRELEVLQHVSRMLSTEEIAQEMHLSADTIKSHLKSIFRKLGVSRRREAVRRAQQLALI